MKHILLIEDDNDQAVVMQRSLVGGSVPFRVSHVANLAGGRAAAEQDPPDLALVDSRLPDGSGAEFVIWSESRFPVILLADEGNERTAVDAIKAGALDYIVKSSEVFTNVSRLVERALRDWDNLRERKQAESRLEAINHLLATMGPNFVENAGRLIALLSREIGAQFAFYSQVAGRKLCAVAEWHVQSHLSGCVRCGCPACATALSYAAGHLQHVTVVQADESADPVAHRIFEHHAFLGHVVDCQRQAVGILCLFFNRPYRPMEADRRLLGIFAAALGGEENRRRTAAELRASDERYRKIVQTAIEGIWVTDERDRITFANQRLAQMLGCNPEELLQRPVRDFLDAADLVDHEHQSQLSRMGQPTQFERRLRRHDGAEFWTWVSGSPLFDDDGNYRGAFAMFTDVTERRQLETQLRQAQKLESVGQLAGGIAHDFNNILAAITMHLSLLHQNPNLDEETVDALRELELETKRASSLTRQLLLFSRRSVIQPRSADLNELVHNLLKMLRRLLGENISIQFNCFRPLPQVELDVGMIEQVLMNFSVNARDAMPRGGSLTIATGLVEFAEDASRHHPERRQGRFVTFSVTDSGVGMDESTLKRIFEPFFTTKDIGKGTGLGLPTAHGIVKQHHGWIEVQSQLNRGSTFTVYLPAKALVAADASGAPTHSPVIGGSGTLLLVEDEDIVRRPIGLYLRKLGYNVIEAINGKQALEIWQIHRADIDLLYSDMVMPEGITGLELAEKLRTEKPALKVIISSGYSTEISMQGVPADAGYIYLPKPSPSATIAAAVRDCITKAK